MVVVARGQDLGTQAHDAFAERHRRLVRWLADEAQVHVVALRTSYDAGRPDPDLPVAGWDEVATPPPDRTRAGLVRTELRRTLGRAEPWQGELRRVVAAAAPDVVVAVGPWIDAEPAVLYPAWPSLYLLEEDLWVMPELASQSRRGVWFRRGLRAVGARSRWAPDAVAVIGEAEVAPARRRFPRSEVVLWRHSLPAEAWPAVAEPSDGEGVLVVGNLAEGRNAEGLARLLAELDHDERGRAVPVSLVSGAGLHPDLEPWAARGRVRVVPGDDLPATYRRAAMAVVASDRATGFKTTVLQAWASGVPAVVHRATADTLGAGADGAVAVGASPEELADRVRWLAEDGAARCRLARAGLARAAALHGEAGQREHVVSVVRGLAGEGTSGQRAGASGRRPAAPARSMASR